MHIYYISRKRLVRIFIILLLTLVIIPTIYRGIRLKVEVPAFMYSNSYLKNRIIVLDAGHGGIDSGVVHPSGIMEKDINLDIVKHIKDFLEGSGAQCILTRDRDMELSHLSSIGGTRHRRDLNARVNIIDESQADLFISIHVNTFPQDESVKGPIVFYYYNSEYSKGLAETIQNRLNEGYSRKYKGKKKPFNKIQGETYYILRNTRSPGVIIETGFISNKEDFALLSNSKFRKLVAYQIYIAIGEFLGE